MDSACYTDPFSSTDPTLALLHGSGMELIGCAKTIKDTDTDPDGHDAPTAEDTPDSGRMSKHALETSKICGVNLTSTAIPSDKFER